MSPVAGGRLEADIADRRVEAVSGGKDEVLLDVPSLSV